MDAASQASLTWMIKHRDTIPPLLRTAGTKYGRVCQSALKTSQ
jgi:hypothetical protein